MHFEGLSLVEELHQEEVRTGALFRVFFAGLSCGQRSCLILQFLAAKDACNVGDEACKTSFFKSNQHVHCLFVTSNQPGHDS